MSTRATIKLIGDWHLYNELLGNGWEVYLEFPTKALGGDNGNLYIRIPTEVWAALRQYAAPNEHHLHQSQEELREEAVAWVSERISKFQSATTKSEKLLVGLRGLAITDVEKPFEQQVEDYIRYYTPPKIAQEEAR